MQNPRFKFTPSSRWTMLPTFQATVLIAWKFLSGPVLRDTARLSQRYPLLRAMGFLVSQHGQLGAIPPPPFLSDSPLESMRSGGAIPPPPPQKGYLSDTGAIPHENKTNACDTPLCDTISKGYCAIWGGISHWAAKESPFGKALCQIRKCTYEFHFHLHKQQFSLLWVDHYSYITIYCFGHRRATTSEMASSKGGLFPCLMFPTISLGGSVLGFASRDEAQRPRHVLKFMFRLLLGPWDVGRGGVRAVSLRSVLQNQDQKSS